MTLIFDTETTGKADFTKPPEDPCQPRLVQLGAQLLDHDLLPIGELNLIIKPDGFEIPAEAANVHGISTQQALSYGVPERMALDLFADFVGKAKRIVAHNIAFDAIIIGRAFAIHGMTVTPPEPYCTMKAATNVCKIPGRNGFKWPTLQEAHQVLLGKSFDGAHEAMADVRACARIYAHLIHGDRPVARPIEPARPSTPPLDETHPDAEYDDDTLMPFGKHRGKRLGDLPGDYCEWLYEQENLSDKRLYKWLHGK